MYPLPPGPEHAKTASPMLAATLTASRHEAIPAPYRADLPARVSVLLTPDVGRKARFNVLTMGSAGCGNRSLEGLRFREY